MDAPLHTENVRKNKVIVAKFVLSTYLPELTTEYEKRTVPRKVFHEPTKP